MKTKQTIKVNPKVTAMLEAIYAAIPERKAYLDTFRGKRIVTGYNHETGWAVTNNTGNYLDQSSFMVCLDAIKIEA